MTLKDLPPLELAALLACLHEAVLAAAGMGGNCSQVLHDAHTQVSAEALARAAGRHSDGKLYSGRHRVPLSHAMELGALLRYCTGKLQDFGFAQAAVVVAEATRDEFPIEMPGDERPHMAGVEHRTH